VAGHQSLVSIVKHQQRNPIAKPIARRTSSGACRCARQTPASDWREHRLDITDRVMVEAVETRAGSTGIMGNMRGHVRKLDYEQHYGSIVDEAKRDWVFHRSAVVGPSRFGDLMVGDTVEFEPVETERGARAAGAGRRRVTGFRHHTLRHWSLTHA